MAIDFDGTGDQVNIDVVTNWMRNINKGSILAFITWDVPASQVDTVLMIDRGAGGAGARFLLEVSSFAPAPVRTRTRRLDADAEYFSASAAGVDSAFKSLCGTADWTAVQTRLYNNAVEDASSPFAPTWTTGSTSNTDPQAGNSNIGASFNGVIHSLYTWHRVLSLAEIQCITQSDGASMVYDDLQSMHLLDHGSPGASVTGANSVKDVSNLGRTGSPAGNAVYAESRIRRRRVG